MSRKQFTEVTKPTLGNISVKCPDCKNIFGLSADFIDKHVSEEIVYHFNCPYCGVSHQLKND